MKNFIILFDGGEGSSAIVSQLKNFDPIDIIWFEPFDNHHLSKPISEQDLNEMFNIIYNNKQDDVDKKILGNIYSKYSDKIITDYDKNHVRGFKMRPKVIDIRDTLKNNQVVVFVLIRKNKLKWAVSKLERNTLQFDLVKGNIKENPKLTVNFDILSENIDKCTTIINKKYKLINEYKNYGIDAHPIYYEDFCNDKQNFFKNMFDMLKVNIDDSEIDHVLTNKKCFFKKVHSDVLSDFITNYDQFLDYVKNNNLIEYLV